MRCVCLSTLLFLITAGLQAQKFTPTELLHLPAYKATKFKKLVTKRGFSLQEQKEYTVSYIYNKPDFKFNDGTEKLLTKNTQKNSNSIEIKDLTPQGYNSLKELVHKQKFLQSTITNTIKAELFQKDGYTVIATPLTKVDSNNNAYYNVWVEERKLPKAKSVHYAEDLLQLNSHVHIATVFGEKNVTRDVFINTDGTTKKCSVVFPNTSYEAVFLWKDEENYRGVQSIRIGGPANTKASIEGNRTVLQNRWLSNQGIYPGMSLKELDMRNGKELEFYGWDWNSGGTIASNNNGKLKLDKVSLVLSCYNCNTVQYSSSKINSSTNAFEEDKKIHISTLIVLPEE